MSPYRDSVLHPPARLTPGDVIAAVVAEVERRATGYMRLKLARALVAPETFLRCAMHLNAKIEYDDRGAERIALHLAKNDVVWLVADAAVPRHVEPWFLSGAA